MADERCEKRLVIREGQIVGLGPPAICRLAKLIPLHGMGLPGSYPTFHPPSLTGPTHSSTLQNITLVPLCHINTDIDLYYNCLEPFLPGTLLWLICINLFFFFFNLSDTQGIFKQ